MFFRNLRIKFDLIVSNIIWLDCEPYGIQSKRKEYNQHSSVFKQSSLANLRKITFILFESHISNDKYIDFYFFLLS